MIFGIDLYFKHCGEMAKDITNHGMADCSKLAHQRKLFQMTMNFYDATKEVDLTKKEAVFPLALSKKCFMNEFCKLLVIIWKTDTGFN